MFNLMQTAKMNLDGSTTYKVLFNITKRYPTLEQFVNQVLTRSKKSKEWGKIYINTGEVGWYNAPFFEYRLGEIKRDPLAFDWEIMNWQVGKITAHGAFTHLDYMVYFDRR